MHRYLRRTTCKFLPALLLMAIFLTDGILAEKSFSQTTTAPSFSSLAQPAIRLVEGNLLDLIFRVLLNGATRSGC